MEYNNEPTSHQIGEDVRITAFYFMPNITDYKKLSPYAFRLYAHFKRVTGEEGKCWQSVNTIAKYCKMSTGMVTKARKELYDAGLIDIRRVPNNKGFDYYSITIRDIWDENKAHSMNPNKDKEFTAPSPHEQTPSYSEQPPSPHEISNTPLSNTPDKNTPLSTFVEKPEPVYEEFNNQADMPQSFVDEYKPVKPPKKSKSDPRYLHIAYSAFYSVTSRRPNRELVDTIIEIIGDTPDTDKLRACHKEWLMRGYNQNSIKWLEWYRDGIPGIKRNEVKAFRPTDENDPFWDVVHR